MQEIRYAKVNSREVPVVISDEKEALLAAKAAGRALVGLWDPKKPEQDLGPAVFLVENKEDADQEFLERVARRHLGLPWKICETRRLLIREIRGEDFTEIWDNQIGQGFSTMEELEAYTKHQYSFYGFGFWALEEKKNGDLVGVAGVTVPRSVKEMELYALDYPEGEGELELGYHIFVPYRKKGYAEEACRAVLSYVERELEPGRILAGISRENIPSKKLAWKLGFLKKENKEKTCQTVSKSCILDTVYKR